MPLPDMDYFMIDNIPFVRVVNQIAVQVNGPEERKRGDLTGNMDKCIPNDFISFPFPLQNNYSCNSQAHSDK